MAAPVPEVFDHSGLWTEEDSLALPVTSRWARADPGRPLVLTEPISVTLDLTTLAASTHSPAGGLPFGAESQS